MTDVIQSPDPVQQPGGGERQLLLDQPEVTIIVPITDLQADIIPFFSKKRRGNVIHDINNIGNRYCHFYVLIN